VILKSCNDSVKLVESNRLSEQVYTELESQAEKKVEKDANNPKARAHREAHAKAL